MWLTSPGKALLLQSYLLSILAYVISAFAPTSSASIAIIEPMVLPFLLLGGFFKDNTWVYLFYVLLIWGNGGFMPANFAVTSSLLVSTVSLAASLLIDLPYF